MMPPGHSGPSMFWMWGRGRPKIADSGPANSGLTGDPVIEEPQQPEGPKDLRGRWRNLKQSVRGTAAALPRVIRLVWDASPTITTGLFAVTVIAGIIPAISAYMSKLLVNAVVLGIEVHNHPTAVADAIRFDFGPFRTPIFTTVNGIIFIAVLQLLIFALIAFLSTARNITQQLLQNAVSMRIQLMVMEKAASLDLAFYEDPASYDLLRRAQTDSINRPVLMISTAFGLVQTALTFVTMIALLVVVSPLLALLALLSPVPAFIADTRYGWRGYNIARWGSRLLRRMNYLVTLLTTDSYAKEVKLFGLGRYFIDRYRLIGNAYYGRQRRQVVRRHLVAQIDDRGLRRDRQNDALHRPDVSVGVAKVGRQGDDRHVKGVEEVGLSRSITAHKNRQRLQRHVTEGDVLVAANSHPAQERRLRLDDGQLGN